MINGIISNRNILVSEIEIFLKDYVRYFYENNAGYSYKNELNIVRNTYLVIPDKITTVYEDYDNQICINNVTLTGDNFSNNITNYSVQFSFDICLNRPVTFILSEIKTELQLLHNHFNKRGSFKYNSSFFSTPVIINYMETTTPPEINVEMQSYKSTKGGNKQFYFGYFTGLLEKQVNTILKS